MNATDENHPWDVVASIAEARVLKAVIGWTLTVVAIVITVLSIVGYRTAVAQVESYVKARVDSVVAARIDTVALTELVAQKVDSLALARIVETDVDSLAALVAAGAVGKLLVSIADEPEPAASPPDLVLGTLTSVEVEGAGAVFLISVRDAAEYEIRADGLNGFDPIISLVIADSQEFVGSDDDGGGGLSSLLRVELEAEGEYELRVQGYGVFYNQAGTATVIVEQVDQLTAPDPDSRGFVS